LGEDEEAKQVKVLKTTMYKKRHIGTPDMLVSRVRNQCLVAVTLNEETVLSAWLPEPVI